MVRRKASSHRRRIPGLESSSLQAAALETIIGAGPTPLQSAEERAQVQLLSQLLAGMKENKREVFILVELEEMKVNEVAAALDIPINTAHSRLRLARMDFEAALERWKKSEAGRSR